VAAEVNAQAAPQTVASLSGISSAPVALQGDLWLVLGDPLPNRVFFDCGIVERLRGLLGERLVPIFPLHRKHIDPWLGRLEGLRVLDGDELIPYRVPFAERVVRRVDIFLDRRVGFYPLAIRHSQRHGFHRGRWVPGHEHVFLDPTRAGRLPRWEPLESAMFAWHFSPRRYAPAVLLERMRAECGRLVVTNLQAPNVMPFLIAARRLGIDVVGNIASWDHTVGKGVVSPHLDRYLVQNGTMRDDLERYHGIDRPKIVVTGWPQTDIFHRRYPNSAYRDLLRALDMDVDKRVVLFAGNTPTNSPYEGNLVSRLVDWWAVHARDRFSLLFRPHPRDKWVGERFARALSEKGVGVQEASYTDLGDLALLLQNVDCVVANAGTVLLDALVNDRPAVCVLYDEAAPAGQTWARLNVVGDHYRELAESGAFYRAESFDGIVRGIERSLARPAELEPERRRVSLSTVGVVDGLAAQRVAEALVGPLGSA
jgi:CDP-glycerol:poly(glycerophosphate) glycerophosphotransferase